MKILQKLLLSYIFDGSQAELTEQSITHIQKSFSRFIEIYLLFIWYMFLFFYLLRNHNYFKYKFIKIL